MQPFLAPINKKWVCGDIKRWKSLSFTHWHLLFEVNFMAEKRTATFCRCWKMDGLKGAHITAANRLQILISINPQSIWLYQGNTFWNFHSVNRLWELKRQTAIDSYYMGCSKHLNYSFKISSTCDSPDWNAKHCQQFCGLSAMFYIVPLKLSFSLQINQIS